MLKTQKMSYKLDLEEREILEAFENNRLPSAPDAEQKIREAKQRAENTIKKNKRINLRLTERDFELAHIRAMEEGLPYQTMLAGVIHRYLNGRLTERY